MSLLLLPKDIKILLFSFLDDEKDLRALRWSCKAFLVASDELGFAILLQRGVEHVVQRNARQLRLRRQEKRDECFRSLLICLTCCCCCGLCFCDDQEGD
jgi:hypothetical protein